MNELKREHVMRALVCHSLADISTCDDCPYCDISEQGNCGCDMARDALALLREKDAEIERLHATCTELKHKCSNLHAEAINAFAKRLKTFYGHLKGKTVGGSVGYHIDQIVKEMGADTCVCCGDVIPEGRQVCPNCERKDDESG